MHLDANGTSSSLKRISSTRIIGLGFEEMSNEDSHYSGLLSAAPMLARRGSSSNLTSHSAQSSTSSRPPSFIQESTFAAPLMTQSSSTSSSTAGPPSPNSHNRQISLTSACLPATASYTPDRNAQNELTTSRLSPNSRSMSDFGKESDATGSMLRSNSARSNKGWKPFSWFSKSSLVVEDRIMLQDSPLLAAESSAKMSRSKSAYSHQGQRGFLCLPYSVVSPLLGPFSSLLLSSSSNIPSKGSPALPTKKPKLAIRLFSMFYVLFSLIYLSNHILGLTSVSSSKGSDSRRLIARQSDGSDSQDQLVMGGWVDRIREKMPLGASWPTQDGADDDLIDDTSLQDEEEQSPIEDAPAINDVASKWNSISSSAKSELSLFTHPYRFSKMHAKLSGDLLDNIEPFAFRGDKIQNKGEVTACLYTNEAWLDQLPEFVKRWNGPVSLVFESIYGRTSSERVQLLQRLADLRKKDSDMRNFVDIHLISSPPSSEIAANRSRERLITNPIASNFHLNLARFFARTDMVWLVGDARIMPSPGLRRKLTVPSVKKLVMSMGDALVVPTFAPLRKGQDLDDASNDWAPTLSAVRSELGLMQAGLAQGVSSEEFAELASGYVAAHHSTLQMSVDKWPKKKATLVGLSSSHPPASVMSSGEAPPSGPIFALYDQAWDPNRGPSNWPLWRKGSVDPRLSEGPEVGGGAGLGINGGIGGGHVVYRVADYELHYAPSVIISKDAQPWCTERFEYNKAACVYQMFLSGAELWVLPDEWAFTLEVVDAPVSSTRPTEAQTLKDTIASRLYIKYQSECCMHFGREFLSMNMWEHPRAAHLRNICDKVSAAWGLESSAGASSAAKG